MVSHIIFEGSSTAEGWGDEEGRFGFAGRVANHIRTHNNPARQNHKAWPWVYTHLHGKSDRNLDSVNRSFNALVHGNVLPSSVGETEEIIGIFVVTPSMRNLYKTGAEATEAAWRQELGSLESNCRNLPFMECVILSPLVPPKGYHYANGTEADVELRQRMDEIAEEMTSPWALRYATVASVLGEERAACTATDDVHPNARGYRKVAEFLLPIINRKLGIPPEYDKLESTPY